MISPFLNVPGGLVSTAYALEITGDSMLPVYREGDIVIICPKAAMRKGDRVVVKTTGGKVMAKVLQKKCTDRWSRLIQHRKQSVKACDEVC